MSGRWRGGCSTLSDLGLLDMRCCDSCHGDWDEGYDSPLEFDLPNGDWLDVCCSLANNTTIDRAEVLRRLDKEDEENNVGRV